MEPGPGIAGASSTDSSGRAVALRSARPPSLCSCCARRYRRSSGGVTPGEGSERWSECGVLRGGVWSGAWLQLCSARARPSPRSATPSRRPSGPRRPVHSRRRPAWTTASTEVARRPRRSSRTRSSRGRRWGRSLRCRRRARMPRRATRSTASTSAATPTRANVIRGLPGLNCGVGATPPPTTGGCPATVTAQWSCEGAERVRCVADAVEREPCASRASDAVADAGRGADTPAWLLLGLAPSALLRRRRR